MSRTPNQVEKKSLSKEGTILGNIEGFLIALLLSPNRRLPNWVLKSRSRETFPLACN